MDADSLHSRRRENLRNHIFVSRRRAYAFVPISKNAGTTLKSGLWTSERVSDPAIPDWTDMDTLHDAPKGAVWSTLDMWPFSHASISDTLAHRYLFTFIRNPYVRLLSCYLNKLGGSETRGKFNGEDVVRIRHALGLAPDEAIDFDAFVVRISQQTPQEMDRHWQPQWYASAADCLSYDRIGRLETFDRDIAIISQNCFGTPPHALFFRKRNTTDALARVHDYYSGSIATLVFEIYRRDFDMFGYLPEVAKCTGTRPMQLIPAAV